MAEKRIPRPRDPIALAKLIGDIATGQVADAVSVGKNAAAAEKGRKGAKSRAQALTAEQRADIGRIAAEARWKKAGR